MSSRKWLLTSAESQVPGIGLGQCALNATFLVKGKVGDSGQKRPCVKLRPEPCPQDKLTWAQNQEGLWTQSS